MKKLTMISSLFLAGTLALTACEPKDVAVMSGEQSQRLKKNAENRKKARTSRKLQFSHFGGASLMMDMHVQALEVLSLALPEADATKTAYKVGDVKEVSHEGIMSRSVALWGDKTPLIYFRGAEQYKLQRKSKDWRVRADLSPEGLESLEAVAEKSFSSVDLMAGGRFINFSENQVVIRAHRVTQKPGYLQVELVSVGRINGRLDGQVISPENFEMKINFLVSEASLGGKEILIQDSRAQWAFLKGEGRKPFIISLEGTAMSVELNGLCNTLLGQAQIKTRNNPSIVFEKNQVLIQGARFKSALAECGKRPTVDLSRLFSYY